MNEGRLSRSLKYTIIFKQNTVSKVPREAPSGPTKGSSALPFSAPRSARNQLQVFTRPLEVALKPCSSSSTLRTASPLVLAKVGETLSVSPIKGVWVHAEWMHRASMSTPSINRQPKDLAICRVKVPSLQPKSMHLIGAYRVYKKQSKGACILEWPAFKASNSFTFRISTHFLSLNQSASSISRRASSTPLCRCE
jgi:hypothetical protein